MIKGFLFAAAAAGIKASGRPDLAGFLAEMPCHAAAVSTTNSFKAAPVLRNSEVLAKSGLIRGALVNSGCANACTGPEGYEDARLMARLYARQCGVHEDEILIASTGIIGHRLPIAKIEAALPALHTALSESGAPDFGRAILTTDTKEKIVRCEEAGVTVMGMAKGAGMIAPTMATMLGFIYTNLRVEPDHLRSSLLSAVEHSFNAVSVDGDMSTNDTVMVFSPAGVLAPGPAGAVRNKYSVFDRLLRRCCFELAMKILDDGEGATKIIKIRCGGSLSRDAAKKIAVAISRSLLFKTAMFGCDLNWGRILAAAGSSGVEIDPETVTLIVNGDRVFYRGRTVPYDEQVAAAKMKQRDIEIQLLVGENKPENEFTYYTNDLSIDYVKINADYST